VTLNAKVLDGWGPTVVSAIVYLTTNHSRSGTIKKIIETIAQALVDQPDLVSVTEIVGLHTSIVEVKVAEADIGKIIGKQGRTAVALRTILSAVSAKGKKRSVLEIVE
jgi:predicted RNA-binding protein YlqC (UPF0109 family)